MTHSTVRSFMDACAESGVPAGRPDESALPPAVSIPLPAASWQDAAAVARRCGLRWSAFWANPMEEAHEAFCVLEGAGAHLVLRTRVAVGEHLPSQASIYPAADRPERHAHDLTGIELTGAPDDRRWTRHRAWSENEFPLQSDFCQGRSHNPTPPDNEYPFARARGHAVVEIPVGPVHAGIIEPGHFRFQAVGEAILHLEERLGYVHKGIEKLTVGRDTNFLARVAGRVSGDTTVAHTWAACQAVERALGADVPPRALWLRALMAERERVANHLGDIGAICNDVGFSFAHYQLSRLRERFVRTSAVAFGHRLMMDRVVPGGVACDLGTTLTNVMAEEGATLAAETAEIVLRLEDSESLEDRLMTTGRLSPEQADRLGVVGYVGRASGRPFDVRRDAAYAPYDRFDITVPTYRAGDVAARARIRADEIQESLRLIGKLLDSLPAGEVLRPLPPADHDREGLGIVEGWRGEIVTYVRIGADGRVVRFFPRDPSWLTWPALELMVQENIVPDFPVCNKSVNASYSGHDL